MSKIFKYPIRVTQLQEIALPWGAEILSIQCQGSEFMIWALVIEGRETEIRQIYCFGTGHQISASPIRHIATVQCASLVWHFFEK